MGTERAWPDVAIPPGETLAETLEARGMTQAELARRTNRPPQAINEIVRGAKEITPETAIQFERVLGVPAQFWVRLEADYRFNKARLEDHERLKEEASLATAFPYKAMAKLGWVPEAKAGIERTRYLVEFFGVATLESVREVQGAAFRRARIRKLCPEALAAWLRRGEQEADRIQTSPFDADALQAALDEIRALTLSDARLWSTRLVNLLAGCGVAAVFTPHLPGTGVNGATHWRGGKAVVQTSLRGRWADIFWFTFFHELGHVLLHSRKETFVEYQDARDGALEKEADAFARDALIPQKDLDRFLASAANPTSVEVTHFARSIGVAPGIVVGRLQHEQVIDYSQLNTLRVRLQWIADEDAGAN